MGFARPLALIESEMPIGVRSDVETRLVFQWECRARNCHNERELRVGG